MLDQLFAGQSCQKLPGFGTPTNTPTVINCHKGAEVGYHWLAKTGDKPLTSGDPLENEPAM